MILIVLPDIAFEDRLLEQARRGSQDALRQIYEDYFSPIYSFIRLRVDESQVAEDLTSEVFLELVSAFKGKNAPRHSLRGWLFRVARHILHDHYGKREQFTETTLDEWLPMSGDESSPDHEINFIRTLDMENARRAILRLPFEQQEVIILRFAQMLNLQETADIMNKSVSAIKSLQFRAVNALRRILREMGTEGWYV